MTTLAVDNTFDDPTQRAPLVLNHHEFHTVTEKICSVSEARRAPLAWHIAFVISLSLLGILGVLILYLFAAGVGVWGNMNPVMWGFPIINFVFWVGIGHAGTLISAILHLFRQKWRTGINRFAEAMTIFAVICAGMFPGIHIGRVWLFYWMFPIPNQMEMWPQFRSPLLWDVFAIGTYFTVSSGRTCCWRRSRRPWCCRSTPSCPSTSRSRRSPVGTRRSSRRTSLPGRSSAASRWS